MTILLGPDGNPIQTKADSHIAEDGVNRNQAMFHRNGYNMPWPTQFMEPVGLLKPNPACAALWFFLGVAHRVAHETPHQVTLEGDEDTRVNLVNVAASIAICYGVSVPDMFESEVVRRAEAEAERIGRGMEPKISRFIHSGGQVYNIFDRDADAATH